ncbi:MAG TPA: ABC transporter ATP-binding protein [Patescibacteria group bacterium]
MTLLSLQHVDKIYQSGKILLPVLHNIDLEIKKGEMVAIMGPSGSGKSTLMNIIGLLDRPSNGTLMIDGETVDLSMPDRKLAMLRNKKIGFVFQSFNLLPRISALGNVLVPTAYAKQNRKQATARALNLLEKVGLKDRSHHKPTELSGGERQRVAIARALINNPEIILADEPTGNLDSRSGAEIMTILRELHKEGKTVIIITHDAEIGKQCQRTVRIQDGEIAGGKHD